MSEKMRAWLFKDNRSVVVQEDQPFECPDYRPVWIVEHENGGQESEAGAYRLVHSSGREGAWVNGEPSQYMAEYAANEGHTIQRAFAAPPSAPAIEAAAYMRAAEAVACPGRTIFDTEKAIIALIPKDGRTQLEEFGMKVATETRAAVLINTREDLFTEDSSLRAIVTNLIGVTPLSSETVSGEGK